VVKTARAASPPGGGGPAKAGPHVRLVDVGGHRLHVVCQGDGVPPVLLEAGIAASSLSWALVQPAIARFAKVCAYDRAGLGWSDAAASGRTFARVCDDLDAVRRHVHLDARVVLVGHSFGSLVVRGLAARHPQHVAGLVLIDPPTEWLDASPAQEYRITRAMRLARVGAILARLGIVRVCLSLVMGGRAAVSRRVARAFGATAEQTLERLVTEINKLPPELRQVVQAHWCQPKSFRAMGDYLRVLHREAPAIVAAAPPPEIPVIVISGSHQSAPEIANHRRLAEASQRGQHVIASDSGHWVLFDRPDLIVEAVRGFVDVERHPSA
jgi:pimeloyl-ACP methyl ester carboxylesterase